MEEEYHILPSSLLAKKIGLAKRLDDVIVHQMKLNEENASVDDIALNTQEFNDVSEKIIDDKTIQGDDRIILLRTISSYSNLFITSLKDAEKEYIDIHINGIKNK